MARAPAPASRALTRLHVPRLEITQVPYQNELAGVPTKGRGSTFAPTPAAPGDPVPGPPVGTVLGPVAF